MPNIASIPGMPDFKSFFSAVFAAELSLSLPPILAWDQQDQYHDHFDDQFRDDLHDYQFGGQQNDDDDDQFHDDVDDDDEHDDRFDDDGPYPLVILHHLHHHVIQRAEHWARVREVEGDLGK